MSGGSHNYRRSPVAGACPGCGSGTILDAPRGHARCAEPGCDEWAGKPDSSGTCATFCQPHCPDCQSEWFGKIPIVKLSREDLLKLYP